MLGALALACAAAIPACRTPKSVESGAETQPAAPPPDITDLLDKPLYTFDETEVDRYLRALPEIEPDLRKRIVHLSRQNIGQPYEIYLLGEFPFEEHDPDPIYCLGKGDCVVFSEHMYAMGLSRDWWSFLKALQRIRYKDGEIGMLTRNHYGIPDWNPNNAFLFDDITRTVGKGEVAVPLTMVCRRSRFLKQFGIGQDIPDEPISNWYIPKERIPEVQHEFQDADMVNIIRGSQSSQWCGHVGMIAIADDGTVDFLHSARPAVREQPLVEYVNGDKRCVGIKILRLRPDAERIMADALTNTPAATPVSEDVLNAAIAARRSQNTADVRYPPVDWRGAMHLQAYRLGDDSPIDVKLQQALVRLDKQVAQRHGMAEDDRAFGVLTLTDQRLALVNPDAMFYAASVPKICILVAYFEQNPDAASNLPDDVRRELERMIKVSDNTLAAKYGNLVGIEKTQELLQSKRYRFYDKKRSTGLWYGKHYAQGSPRFGDPVHDYSHGANVRQCLRFYLMMEQGKLVSAAASTRMREIFTAPRLEHLDSKFVTGLQGRDLSIIRKSGTWEDWYLDTARVDHGDQVYLIAGMTHHPQGAAYLAEMAAGVDDLLCGKSQRVAWVPPTTKQPTGVDEPLVEIAEVDPRIIIDLRYATPDNFTGKTLYPAGMRCRLRASVAKRLSRVQDRLVREGLGLKIYDGYRPLSVQRTMWEVMPDPRYVANPAKGSRHNRGAAVDVTLVDRNGKELEMPTPYDDFTEAAHRNYKGGSTASRRNRKTLEEAMTAEGFTGLATEWWHFDAPHWRQYAMVENVTPATETITANNAKTQSEPRP